VCNLNLLTIFCSVLLLFLFLTVVNVYRVIRNSYILIVINALKFFLMMMTVNTNCPCVKCSQWDSLDILCAVFAVSTVTDSITLINTPSSGDGTNHLLTVKLLKVGA